ncbi:hypothetical protein LV779_10300 [Streptomyces thinghirensis]|nr:hypothetical protein [Streptomyces thinghirensis]
MDGRATFLSTTSCAARSAAAPRRRTRCATESTLPAAPATGGSPAGQPGELSADRRGMIRDADPGVYHDVTGRPITNAEKRPVMSPSTA